MIRRAKLRRMLLAILGLSLVSLGISIFKTRTSATPFPPRAKVTVKQPTFSCHRRPGDDVIYAASAERRAAELRSRLKAGKLRAEERILVLLETEYSAFGRHIRDVLDALRFPYKAEVLGRQVPALTTSKEGKYGLVIMENYYKYLNMDEWNRQLMDKYLRDYGVALVSFLLPRPDKPYRRAKVRGFPITVHQHLEVSDLRIAPDSALLRLARPGATLPEAQRARLTANWLLFSSQEPSLQPLLLAEVANSSKWLSAAFYDQGEVDGIQRVLFGRDFGCWLVKLLFVDSLTRLSAFSLPLQRYLQIDIDDIFVGRSGLRMTQPDVQALVEGQAELRKWVPGFRFHLGFSGKFFQSGSEAENAGDRAIIGDSFSWFGHMWRHSQAHRSTEPALLASLARNRQFAREHGMVVNSSYAVAPHHAGVYPVHEPLYSAWEAVWGVKVTSTEEYPHLKPASRRRGFVHRDVMVLPRQTCGLYTKTAVIDDYPGGPEALEASLEGGELFFTFFLQPFLIFMTHSNNYALERLALYLFRSQLAFLRCWTTLEMAYLPPIHLATAYFRAYPNEVEPVWGNPCLDKKHLAIWAPEKSCARLPRALVLGPQKTGTSALHSFLALHPDLLPNRPLQRTFEETQFFSTKSYRRGIDWYMSNFEPPANATGDEFFFEKSANYFDAEAAPRRVKALLPEAKLIAILISPSQRAYSWYQHQRAHGDEVALGFNFSEVIRAPGDEEGRRGELWKLRSHCLYPGLYARHLERWLDHFSVKQLLLLDGSELKEDPPSVMETVLEFLSLRPLDYRELLKFDPRKGFFCEVRGAGGTKCLGKGKGRLYEPMREEDRAVLADFFRPHNIQLHRLLTRLGYQIPEWLKEDLRTDPQ